MERVKTYTVQKRFESLGFKIHNRMSKLWITREVVSKTEERRQTKKLNTEEGRKK